MKDEFLSEEDLDLANLSAEELERYWDLWLHQAQASNDLDAHTYSHGVFVEEPAREPTPFTQRERRILDFLLDGGGETLELLRGQVAQARAIRRLHSGVGFFVDIEPGEGAHALPGRPTFWLRDVYASVLELEHEMGLQLLVENGVARMLEGFIVDSSLPEDWHLLELKYVDAFRSTDPPIERPTGAPRYLGEAFTNVPGLAFTSEVREPPPPYPRP